MRRLRRWTFVSAIAVLVMVALPAFGLNVTGTNGNDVLTGTASADRINGKDGNDRLLGLAGNDALTGGRGRDYLSGGDGADRLEIRDNARDTADCGPGRDRVVADRQDIVRRNCEVVFRPFLPPSPHPPAPPPPPSPPPTPVDAGSYKGATMHGNFVFFDVLQDRTMRGFRLNDIREPCDGPRFIYGTVDAGPTPVPIDDEGRFLIEWRGTWEITWDDSGNKTPATYYIKIAGYIRGSSAAGTVRATDEFDYEGRHWTCSSGDETWTANRLP